MPFSAGGGVDAIARLLAEKLRDTLKQNIVVENKPGASGMLGAQYVAKAAPDGTLLLGSAGETAINPYVYKGRMLYSPEKDLAPVTLVTRVPNVLVAGPSLQASSVAELVERARAKPGALTYATSGVGNPQHLNGELLQSLAGITMVHVPYKGASGQLADVASGNVDMTFVSYAGAAPFIQGGRVKALAVTSATRASFARDIPAIAETPGLSAYALENWFGLYAPRARRRRWCSGCTRRCATRWPIRRWRSACASRAASRRRCRPPSSPPSSPARASSTPPSSSAPTSRRTSEEAAMNTDPAGHVAQDWESTCTHT